MLAPALSIILAYSIVLLTSLNIRNLAVTGIERFLCRMLTKRMRTASGFQLSYPSSAREQCKKGGKLTHLVDRIPIILQETPIIPPFRDTLRTATVITTITTIATEQPNRDQLLIHFLIFRLRDGRGGLKRRTHKLISTASQCFSTSFAACNSTSGSLAANCSRAHNDDDGQYSGEGTKKEGFVSPCIHSRLKHTFRTRFGVDGGEEEIAKG
jgi:hypothetical protein